MWCQEAVDAGGDVITTFGGMAELLAVLTPHWIGEILPYFHRMPGDIYFRWKVEFVECKQENPCVF